MMQTAGVRLRSAADEEETVGSYPKVEVGSKSKSLRAYRTSVFSWMISIGFCVVFFLGGVAANLYYNTFDYERLKFHNLLFGFSFLVACLTL